MTVAMTYAQRQREAQRHAREHMQITSVPPLLLANRCSPIPPLDALKRAIAQLESA